MSLSTRIALLVVFVLSAGLGGAGILLSRIVEEAQQKTIDGQLNARMAWMESALDVDYEDKKVELEARGTPPGMAPYWSISTRDGRVLWSSARPPTDEPLAHSSRDLIFGEDTWKVIPSSALQKGQDNEEDDSDDEWRQDRGQERSPTVYWFSEDHPRIDLVLSSASSTREMQAELQRLRDSLAIGIPVAVLVLGIILILLVRWQLGPLTRMAEESGHIGPDDLSRRIGDAGTSAECTRLRAAINDMVSRMADGIARERNFAQAAAHDLRTPLAQLRTQAEIALRHPRTAEEYREALGEMVEDIERLEKMIAGLLLLTRMVSPRSIRNHTTSLKAIIAKSCRDLHPELPQVDTLQVVGEENLIRAAIQNVLENARQYAPKQSPEISFRGSDTTIQLLIADHGPGISPADRERIFDPLVRLDGARTLDNGAGFGLGLAIARNTLRAFAGDISCTERQDGKAGAVFVLTFRKAGTF